MVGNARMGYETPDVKEEMLAHVTEEVSLEVHFFSKLINFDNLPK